MLLAWYMSHGSIAHANVHYPVLCMLLAIRRRLTALDIEAWNLRAGVTQATPIYSQDVPHAARRMLLAALRHLSPCNLESWVVRARDMTTTLVVNGYHAVLCMLLTVGWPLAPCHIQRWLPRARGV